MKPEYMSVGNIMMNTMQMAEGNGSMLSGGGGLQITARREETGKEKLTLHYSTKMAKF